MTATQTLPALARKRAVTGEDAFEELRRVAEESLASRGLPTKKTEAFRFTSVRDLLDAGHAPSEGVVDPARFAALEADDAVLVPLVHGALRAPVALAGVSVYTTAARSTGAEAAVGSVAPTEYFAAANALTFTEAVVIEVADGVAVPRALHLVHAQAEADGAHFTAPRLLVRLGRGAKLTLVETFTGDARSLTNAVAEIVLAEGAELDHVLVSTEACAVLDSVAVRAGERASYRATSALSSGMPARFEHRIELAGAGANAVVSGVLHGRGTALLDHHVRVVHSAPRTTSSQLFRGLADDRSTVVWDGIAEVLQTAPGADVKQESKNLLLSRDAAVHAKPHLEIEIDEVTASHGTTVGSFDRDALFYMHARGLDDDTARGLLLHAFVRGVLDRIPTASVRARLLRGFVAGLPLTDLLEEEVSP